MGDVELGRITIVYTLDEDDRAFSLTIDGDLDYLTVVGLLEAAKLAHHEDIDEP